MRGHHGHISAVDFKIKLNCTKNLTIYIDIWNQIEAIKKKGDDYFRINIFNEAIFKYLESLALFKDDLTTHANTLRSGINKNIALC